jgi:adenine deaminase
MPSDRRHLLAVARGDEPPDLVITGGRVFAPTAEWVEADVAVASGRIAGVGSYSDGERIDASGRYVVPGFIDAHMHLESSKVMPHELARVVVPHGTTAVVCDPHEIANVLGRDGVHWLIDACEGLPLDVYFMAPSCVPASPHESPREPFTIEDIESILRRKRTLGIAEMMNFPAVIAGDESELDKLRASPHVDGHAPGVSGRALDAYAAAGIRSDHEATTLEEAWEKRRRGMWVLIREASNSRDLKALLPLVGRLGPDYFAFCTDDREPDLLQREGHVNQMCRIAVAEGLDPEVALLLASHNPARYHGLRERGSIAPGYRADLLVLPDLTDFRPSLVLKEGEVAFDGDDVRWPQAKQGIPAWVRESVRVAPLERRDLSPGPADGEVRVIEVFDGRLFTGQRFESPRLDEGVVTADPERDLALIAVVERHHATGRIGTGLVTGFGLRQGAFAATVAHDAHNLVVVGTDRDDMLRCIERLVALGGGIVVVAGGEVTAQLPLPVAGLISDRPLDEVVGALDRVHDALRALGVRLEAPLMSLSFLALSVIPQLKITDRGLVDVERSQIVPLQAEREDLAGTMVEPAHDLDEERIDGT